MDRSWHGSTSLGFLVTVASQPRAVGTNVGGDSGTDRQAWQNSSVGPSVPHCRADLTRIFACSRRYPPPPTPPTTHASTTPATTPGTCSRAPPAACRKDLQARTDHQPLAPPSSSAEPTDLPATDCLKEIRNCRQ
ncbi:hypothetical protein T261_1477 [Streptomyces lydicus]|nr:hypothetical protein T261_1477 [Streptomyces lydicus]